MICPDCGAGQEPDSNFCDQCGVPLHAPVPPAVSVSPTPIPPAPLSCPDCGAGQEPDSNFCDQCGTSMNPAVPRTQPAGIIRGLLAWHPKKRWAGLILGGAFGGMMNALLAPLIVGVFGAILWPSDFAGPLHRFGYWFSRFFRFNLWAYIPLSMVWNGMITDILLRVHKKAGPAGGFYVLSALTGALLGGLAAMVLPVVILVLDPATQWPSIIHTLTRHASVGALAGSFSGWVLAIAVFEWPIFKYLRDAEPEGQ